MTRRVLGRTTDGSVARIILNVLALFGDYRAISALTDTFRQTTIFIICFVKKRRIGHGWQVAYATEIHARRIGYVSFDRRQEIIRRLPMHKSRTLFGCISCCKLAFGLSHDHVISGTSKQYGTYAKDIM